MDIFILIYKQTVYIQNLIMYQNAESTRWIPSQETLAKVKTFSTSLFMSPAVVERAIHVTKLAYM